jgi:hypothetical protein
MPRYSAKRLAEMSPARSVVIAKARKRSGRVGGHVLRAIFVELCGLVKGLYPRLRVGRVFYPVDVVQPPDERIDRHVEVAGNLEERRRRDLVTFRLPTSHGRTNRFLGKEQCRCEPIGQLLLVLRARGRCGAEDVPVRRQASAWLSPAFSRARRSFSGSGLILRGVRSLRGSAARSSLDPRSSYARRMLRHSDWLRCIRAVDGRLASATSRPLLNGYAVTARQGRLSPDAIRAVLVRRATT